MFDLTRLVQAVVKLGGSAISEKRRDKAKPNDKALCQLAEEVVSAQVPCVIVHGGGSYGHPLAKKYQIAKGFKSGDQLRGVAETHRSMMALNAVVIDAFLKSGSNPLAISPSSCFTTDNRRISSSFIEPIVSALRLDLTPILYGDIVFDKRLGFTILSGDQIASHLARELKVKRLVFALEVGGVYTKDPSQRAAKLIKKLSLKELEMRAGKASTRTKGSDVTGGMRTKLQEAVPAVRAGITVCFAGTSPEGNIRSAIKGSSFRGTLIEGSRKS